jgi:predicted dehydrogenase
MTKEKIRFGIIGCGAITEIAYLPYFKGNNSSKLTCLVDRDESRALSLAQGLDLNYVGKGVEPIYKYTDAVVVAVPNHLHFPIANECLKAGKHVLCEKPLAITSEQCSELLSRAKEVNVKLAVAHVRRFYQVTKIIKRIVDSRELGDLRSFDFEEGAVFSWPTVSGFIFDKAKAGGGVLMDIGVHILDLLLWWHPYEVVSLDYQDDNLGGMEAFAKLQMVFSTGVVGRVTISRLSVLRNRYRLVFEDGVVEWNPLQWDPLLPKKILVIKFSRREKRFIRTKKESPVSGLLADFVAAVQHDKSPLVAGDDGFKAIQLIDECYRSRKLLPLEWLTNKAHCSCNNLA